MNKQFLYTAVAIIVVVLAFVFLKKGTTNKEGAGDSNSSITITLWEQENDDNQKLLDDITSEFATSEGIQVIRNHYPPEDLRVQFQTAALAKGGADIILVPNDLAGAFSVMGIIHSIENMFDLAPYEEAVIGSVKDKTGHVWGLPFSRGNHLMLLVNKKIVKDPINTVEELLKQAKLHTNRGSKKFGLAYNLNEPFWFASFISMFGDKIYTEETGPKLDSPAMKQALEFVKGLKFNEKIVPDDCDYNCMDTLFTEGKTPIIINGDWSIQKYENLLGQDLGIYPLPKYDKTSEYMQPMISGKYYFLNSNLSGEKLEKVVKLVQKLVSDESQLLFASKSRLLPSLREGKSVEYVKQDSILSQVLEATKHGQPNPMDVEMRAVWDAIRPQLQAIMAGRTTSDEAMKMMQKDVLTKIKDIKN